MLRKGHGGLYNASYLSKGRKKKAKAKAKRRDQIKFIDLAFGRWHVLRFWNARTQEQGKTFHNLHVLGRNDDLWERVRG